MTDVETSKPVKASAKGGIVDGIRTNDGEVPWFRENGKTNKAGNPSFETNLVNVSFDGTKRGWITKCIVEGKTEKATWHSVSKHGSMDAAFKSACDARRDVVDTSSTVPSVVLVDPTTGTVVADKCTKCQKTNVPIGAFAPDPRNTPDTFEEFGAAMEILSDPNATAEDHAEAMATMKELRTLTCFHCREIVNRSRNTGENNLTAACKAMAEKIHADLAKRECNACGKLCGRAMECDHPGRLNKVFDVLRYSEWATPELGPEAMWAEYLKTVPLCAFCHLLESTHNKYHGADSTTMPTTTEKEKRAKITREYREQKAAINAGWKAGKCCFYCKREVKPGEEHAFPWMHSRKKMVDDRVAMGLPPLRKRYTIAALQGSRICPATFVRLAEPEIDAKCELGCANCHMIYETLPELEAQEGRLKEFVQFWEEAGVVKVAEAAAAPTTKVRVRRLVVDESESDEDELPPPSPKMRKKKKWAPP